MDMLIIKKYYWYWIHLIEQTCPSSKNDNIIIFNIISCLLVYYKGWWRRGGRTSNFLPNPLPTSQSVGLTGDKTSKDLSYKLLVVV